MIISEQIDHTGFQAKCRKHTDAELHYIITDCREALAAWKDNPNEGKYLDQINYAFQELNRRRKARTIR